MASVSTEQGLSLLQDPKYSDMTIVCGGHNFKVHKVIVCSTSPFFAKCLDGDFKEAREGTVTIGDTEPFVLGLALVYVYTNTYHAQNVQSIWKQLKPPAKGVSDQLANTIQALEVYQLADRLLMPALRAAACEAFRTALNAAYWGGTADGYAELATLVRRVYRGVSSNASDIRVPLTLFAARRACEVRHGKTNQKLNDLLNEYEPIAFEVYKVMKSK